MDDGLNAIVHRRHSWAIVFARRSGCTDITRRRRQTHRCRAVKSKVDNPAMRCVATGQTFHHRRQRLHFSAGAENPDPEAQRANHQKECPVIGSPPRPDALRRRRLRPSRPTAANRRQPPRRQTPPKQAGASRPLCILRARWKRVAALTAVYQGIFKAPPAPSPRLPHRRSTPPRRPGRRARPRAAFSRRRSGG